MKQWYNRSTTVGEPSWLGVGRLQGPFKPPRHVRTTVEEQSTLQGTTLNLGAKSTQPDDTRPPPSLPPITDGPSAQSSHFMLLLPPAIGLLLICLRRQYRLAYAAAHLD